MANFRLVPYGATSNAGTWYVYDGGVHSGDDLTLNGTVAAAGNPIVGSFAANPSIVTVGGSSTLTASGVTDSGGTITSVNFYRESNGTSGLQIGSDTLVGSGVQNGTTWTLTSDSPSLAAGNYTYYAVATDSTNTNSGASSTALTVNSATATTVDSNSPNPSIVGNAVTFTVTTTGIPDGEMVSLKTPPTATRWSEQGSLLTGRRISTFPVSRRARPTPRIISSRFTPGTRDLT